ncbi:MAG: hypothetical protein EPO24_07415 [Bacteroidetes bacterium]|nr:MAG: hypothetical protein EPO24_07415 [Bacteroidota bacterium]
MIRNPIEVERLKRRQERENPLTLEQKYALLNSMYEEVKMLGKLKSRKRNDDVSHLLAIARMLNAGI